MSVIFTVTQVHYFSWNSYIIGVIIYFLWGVLYSSYLLFYRANIIEMKNIRMQSLNTEIELSNLRSQLNPHFMFNAMNSIKALIDENPKKSKEAVTQLSNVLRNSLVYRK